MGFFVRLFFGRYEDILNDIENALFEKYKESDFNQKALKALKKKVRGDRERIKESLRIEGANIEKSMYSAFFDVVNASKTEMYSKELIRVDPNNKYEISRGVDFYLSSCDVMKARTSIALERYISEKIEIKNKKLTGDEIRVLADSFVSHNFNKLINYFSYKNAINEVGYLKIDGFKKVFLLKVSEKDLYYIDDLDTVSTIDMLIFCEIPYSKKIKGWDKFALKLWDAACDGGDRDNNRRFPQKMWKK